MPDPHSLPDGYRVTLDPRLAQLSIAGPNGAIGPATAALAVAGEAEADPLRGARARASRGRVAIEFRCGAIAGVIDFRVRNRGRLSVEVALTNRSRREVRVERLDLLRLASAAGFAFGGSPRDLRLLSNPRGMGYYAGTRALVARGEADVYELGPIRPDGVMTYERWNQSWTVTALWDRRSRRGVVIGAAQPMREAVQFATEGETFRLRLFPDSRAVAPGATIRSVELQVDLVSQPREGLEAWAELNRPRQRMRDVHRFAGWNSFDYYLNTERLSDILENADAIRSDRALRERIRWICVDSGWEYRWGEYVALEHRFPGGLKNLTRQLRRRGFGAGVWTAPLLVERVGTRLTRWEPEVFVRDERGEYLAVFNDNCFLIDPTSPAGERYLRDLYRGLRAAGIRYFKCDFLELGFAHGRHRFRRDLSLTEVNRRVLEIIRDAIGPDSFLVACIAAPEAAIGLCDAIRISGDMHNRWSNAQLSALNTAWRWWLHGRLAWNDPDMIPIRGPETARDPLGAFEVRKPYAPFRDSGPLFDRREAELWMAFCLLSGGLFTVCDRMELLNAAGRRIARIGLENLSAVAAKPIDFYDSAMPSLFLQEDGDVVRLGVFNWQDERRTIRVHTDGLVGIPDGTVLRELWSGETRTWRGPFAVTVPPHGCLYFRFARR